MFDEELVGGDERDGLPRAAVKEAVRLAGRDLEIDGFGAEGLPFGVGGVPAFLPPIHVAEESNRRWQIGFQMAQDVDFGVFVVIGGEGGIEPHVSDDAGVDVLRVGGVVQTRIHRGESADMPACRSTASDDALRINTELARVLFEPTNRAFRIGDADALAGFACGELRSIGLAEHLVLRRGADESATGKIGTRDAKLPQRATAPCAAVEEDHARGFRFREIVVRREVDLQLARLPGRSLVDVGFSGWSIGAEATFGFGCRRFVGGKRCTTESAEDHREEFHGYSLAALAWLDLKMMIPTSLACFAPGVLRPLAMLSASSLVSLVAISGCSALRFFVSAMEPKARKAWMLDPLTKT